MKSESKSNSSYVFKSVSFKSEIIFGIDELTQQISTLHNFVGNKSKYFFHSVFNLNCCVDLNPNHILTGGFYNSFSCKHVYVLS